jgi:hypothetical protein
MRIVIEIDQSSFGTETGSLPPAANLRIEGAPASPAEPVSTAAAIDAGSAVSVDVQAASEVPADLLARAAALGALNAGPAPGLAEGASDLNAAMVALGGTSGISLRDEPARFPQCNLARAHDQGVTSAGPASS